MKNKRIVKKIILPCVILLLIAGGLWLLEEKAGGKLATTELYRWLPSGFLWLVGLFAWVVTYIGAPLASKRSGRNVSGIPGIAFIAFLIAGLLSPYKWLAVIALADFGIILLPIRSIIAKNKKK